MDIKKQSEKGGKAQQPKVKISTQFDIHAAITRVRFGAEDLQHMIGHSRNSRKQFYFQASRG